RFSRDWSSDVCSSEAAASLRDLAARETRDGCALPQELTDWLAKPVLKRGRGRPPRAATASTVTDASKHAWIRSCAAWAAWWNRRAGKVAAVAGEPGPAFTEVADWLAAAPGVHVGASAVRTWY